jgi:excisionase family DNA binding protein
MTALLAPQEAAKRLHISERTLRDLKRRGQIRYVAVSARRIAYREDDLAEYIDSRVQLADIAETSPVPKRRISKRPDAIVPFSQLGPAR